ncbi:hypothetical protein Ahy_B10g104102 [Arachis hypogaea]|uniref:Uncharacterized protein n=1 Tax=Arachis hypogaea TaxID=3818 RepID=A0A444X4R8_ARAHY|nr:hypothetical protein Ahy_B10g104102 [Arachis hypogaea]
MGRRKSTGRRPTGGCCVVVGQARNAAVLLWVASNGAAGGQIGPVGAAGVPLDGAGLLGGVVSTTARVVLAGAGWCCPRGGAGKKGPVALGEMLRRRYEVVGGRGSPAGEVLQEDGFAAGLGFLRVRLRVSAESEIERRLTWAIFLSPGDYALGYELYEAITNDIELDKYRGPVCYIP